MPKVVHQGFNPWGVEVEDSPILQGPSVTHYDCVTYSNTLEGPNSWDPLLPWDRQERAARLPLYIQVPLPRRPYRKGSQSG